MDNDQLTPRQRVMISLRGGCPGKIPVTVYDTKIPQCTVERKLRNKGLCLVHRTTSYNIYHPNIKTESRHYINESGKKLVRTIYKTPYGELYTLDEPAGFTTWYHERMFKSKEDYKAILFMIKDSVVVPNYNYVVKKSKSLGEDFVLRDNLPLEPLQSLISQYMGVEVYSYEWMDNRDEVLKLYDALVQVARKIYPIVADGPLEFCNYGGNVIPQLIGINNFEKYYASNYNEAAEILHKKRKLIGTHLDADNTPIMDSIANTDLDYIEAYDPGMSPPVETARKIFGNKILWINWPSAWHLNPPEVVKQKTMELIDEATPGDGFIIGITEDVPEERWQENFIAIVDGAAEHRVY